MPKSPKIRRDLEAPDHKTQHGSSRSQNKMSKLMLLHRRSKTSTLASSRCEALWDVKLSGNTQFLKHKIHKRQELCVYPQTLSLASGLQRTPWHFHHFLLKSSSQPRNLPTFEPLISLILFLYFVPAGDKDFLLW